MQRVGDSTSTANGAGEFTQGQPGSGVDATIIAVPWLNAVQRELIHVVSGAGITLDPTDDSQVLKAIRAIQTAANTWANLANKPTTVGGFGITDAFTKAETGNAIQQAIAALVASSPAALDTLKELADALGNDANFATTMTNALSGKAGKATSLAGYGITNAYTKTEIDNLLAVDPWKLMPLAVVIPVFDHLIGSLGGTSPPTDKGYRYVKLTASDAYNAGVLGSESVSGSAPLVDATAVINLASSPLNGLTVRLINTERRSLRAGSSGTVQADALQNITAAITGVISSSTVLSASGAINFANSSNSAGTPNGGFGLSNLTFDASRVARTDTETRGKNIGVTYYMRVL